jgi:hypothetical protein
MTAQEALARALETHYMDVLTIEQAIKPPDMDDDDPLGWRSDATAILAALPDHVLVSRDELAKALHRAEVGCRMTWVDSASLHRKDAKSIIRAVRQA